MRPKHLAVTMEAFHVRVANKLSGEVYLEGRLERGIVPQECVWTHGGGSGEDGCLLLLQKMNLELLQRCVCLCCFAASAVDDAHPRQPVLSLRGPLRWPFLPVHKVWGLQWLRH